MFTYKHDNNHNRDITKDITDESSVMIYNLLMIMLVLQQLQMIIKHIMTRIINLFIGIDNN